MRPLRITNILAWLALGSVLLAACSSDDSLPPSAGLPEGGVGGGAGAGGSVEAGLDAPFDTPFDNQSKPDGDAGPDDGQALDGEPDAEEEPGICGDQMVGPGEECDGTDFGTASCQSYGFSEGSLVCTGDCVIDPSGCSGVETCFDAQDNDGDGDADCDDADCASACASVCGEPSVLPDPANVGGSNLGHAIGTAPSCLSAGTVLGPTVTYKFVPSATGVLDVMLTSLSANLNVSVRSDCDDASTELGCADFNAGAGALERLIVPALQGQTYFIMIGGSGAPEASAYALQASSRAIVCGDAHTDPGEQCDDGATDPGDGCSASCTLEVTEVEPNDTIAQANPYAASFIAQINPQGDVDVMTITVPETASSVYAYVFDMGDGACSKLSMDSYLELLKPDGSVVAYNDDDSTTYCSKLAVPGISAGTYYLRVRASGAAPPTWPYRLVTSVDVCGNGDKTDAEQCDDGNKVAGDGCSPTCTKE